MIARPNLTPFLIWLASHHHTKHTKAPLLRVRGLFQLDDQKIDKEIRPNTHFYTASTLSFFLFNLSHLHVRPVVIVITLFIVVGTVDIYDLLFVI